MLIFAIIFLGVFSFVATFFGALFASLEAVASVCALLIFGCIAVAVFMKNNRAWGWMFMAVIAMVAVEVLAPFESFIEIIISIAIAAYGTYHIKRTLFVYLDRDLRRPASIGGPRLPVWAHTVLRFI